MSGAKAGLMSGIVSVRPHQPLYCLKVRSRERL